MLLISSDRRLYMVLCYWSPKTVLSATRLTHNSAQRISSEQYSHQCNMLSENILFHSWKRDVGALYGDVTIAEQTNKPQQEKMGEMRNNVNQEVGSVILQCHDIAS